MTLIKSLSMEHLGRLLTYVKEWNTNGKHARVAQTVLACILKAIPPAKLMDVEGIKPILEGIVPCAHTQRDVFGRMKMGCACPLQA